MKKLVFFLILAFATPAFAADAVKPAPVVKASIPAAEMKERMALAKKFHEIRPLRDQIDATIIALGDKLPDATRPKYLSDMSKTINYAEVEQASIKAMAEIFNPAELKALVDFYSSDAGKSAMGKMSDYQAKLTPAVAKALDDAIAKIKFGGK